MKNNDKPSLIEKLKRKYRLIIRVEDSLEEKTSFKLNRLNVIMFISTALVLGLLGVYALIAYTSLKQYIPGYGDFKTISKFSELSYKYDSLEQTLIAQVNYLENIRKIYSGNVDDYSSSAYPKKDSINKAGKADLRKKSKSDSVLRAHVDEESAFNVFQSNDDLATQKLKSFIFYPPVKGRITEKFNGMDNHYAVDIVTEPDAGIKSILEGTVIHSEWSINSGYTLIIQHKKNLISLYKHCSAVLKKVGTFVAAGEVIGIVGNTGKLSHGAHLHFELWYDGNPVDPEKYIVFK